MVRTSKIKTLDEQERVAPHLSKWLIRCTGCGKRGYRPDTPETPRNLLASIRVEPIDVDASTLCEPCRAALRR
jgi:hypothetical protein